MTLRQRGRRRRAARKAARLSPRHAQRHLRSRSSIGALALALVLLAVVLVAGTWVGTRAWLAKGEIQQAQKLVTTLKDQVASGKYTGLTDQYVEIRRHTAKARSLTDDPLWSMAEHAPVLGRNLAVMRDLSAVVDDAMRLSEPLVRLARQFNPAALAPKDGKVPLQPFFAAASDVPAAADNFAGLSKRLHAVRTAGTLRQLRDAQAQLEKVVDSAATALAGAVPIVRALPAALGADGPRNYVVMFQNSAELRSLGGTALSFAEIGIDHGGMKMTRAVPAGGGNFDFHEQPVIPVPDGFEGIYPRALGHFIANATLRPSSVTAAQIIQAEWAGKFGEKVDGVLSIDGGALGLLLKAVGPITLSTGEVVNSDNVVSLLLNGVYVRYNSGNVVADDRNQNTVFSETLALTFGRLSSGQFDPVALFGAVRSAADSQRLSLWFANEGEQAALAHTSLGANDLPESTATHDAVGVYLNDQVGAKLNYYLGTTLTTGSAVCRSDGRQVHRLTLAMTNRLPPEAVAGLSPSVSGLAYPRLGLAKGVQRLLVFFYLPPGASLVSTSSNGVPVAATGQHDSGRAVQSVVVDVPPGATRAVTVDILMGTPGKRMLVTDVTPTVEGTLVQAAPLDCSTVAVP